MVLTLESLAASLARVTFASVLGTAVNNDGRSAALQAPNGRAQVALWKQLLHQSNCDVNTINFIETHGSGTLLGDAVEVGAINEIFGARENPVFLGAVKSNIGHLEPAAGMVGMLKAVLAIYHGVLPPNLHFHELNKKITLGSGLALPLVATPLQGRSLSGQIVGAISSFGMGGTNTWCCLEASRVTLPSLSLLYYP